MRKKAERGDHSPPSAFSLYHASPYVGLLPRCPVCGYVTGSVKRKVVPAPGSLSTPMAPPFASTMPWAMARPRPAPPTVPSRVLQNRSKTRSRVAASMQQPVSLTGSATTPPAAAPARASDAPLRRRWNRRRGSPGWRVPAVLRVGAGGRCFPAAGSETRRAPLWRTSPGRDSVRPAAVRFRRPAPVSPSGRPPRRRRSRP
jgi:hypothetical protein